MTCCLLLVNVGEFLIYTSLHTTGHFSRWTRVSQCQNVSILDLVGAKGDGGGGGNWSYK